VGAQDEGRHGVDVESYDQWLAWKYGLRLQRGHSDGAIAPGDTEYEWGDQAALVASLEVVAPVAPQLVAFFYETLFADNPRLRALFPDQMDDQRERLLAALLAVVYDADRPAELVERLQQLGRDHRKYGVRPAHYASVGRALIAALSRFAGEAWTPAVEQAWLARYTLAASTMLAAADADGQPPYWYATVVGHRRLGGDLAILHVRPWHPYPYEPGQHTTLVSRRLPRVWRPYAMATAAPRDGVLEFHVRAQGHGGLSDALVKATTAGDVLRLGAPQGVFTLRRSTGRVNVFVAGGTGWAPTKALLDRLANNGSGTGLRTRLIQLARSGMPYDPDWTQLEQRWAGLSTMLAGSPEEVVGCLPRGVATAQLDAYVCGPPALAEVVCARLVAAGVLPERTAHLSWPGA
jgi:NAD(P)H-flavin reductase/hemoglobin-like flavoprotein